MRGIIAKYIRKLVKETNETKSKKEFKKVCRAYKKAWTRSNISTKIRIRKEFKV